MGSSRLVVVGHMRLLEEGVDHMRPPVEQSGEERTCSQLKMKVVLGVQTSEAVLPGARLPEMARLNPWEEAAEQQPSSVPRMAAQLEVPLSH